MIAVSTAQRGQAAAEYALCVAVLALALLLRAGAEESAAAQLARSFHSFFRACTFLLSIF